MFISQVAINSIITVSSNIFHDSSSPILDVNMYLNVSVAKG